MTLKVPEFISDQLYEELTKMQVFVLCWRYGARKPLWNQNWIFQKDKWVSNGSGNGFQSGSWPEIEFRLRVMTGSWPEMKLWISKNKRSCYRPMDTC